MAYGHDAKKDVCGSVRGTGGPPNSKNVHSMLETMESACSNNNAARENTAKLIFKTCVVLLVQIRKEDC